MPPWRGFLRTPLYNNTGSTARDHLASERTFLAWLRTSLGFVALGIAIERFSRFDLSALLKLPGPPVPSEPTAHKQETAEERKPRGNENKLVLTLIGTGFGSVVYGTGRYFSNMHAIQKGLFRPAYFGAGALGVVVAGMTGAVAWEAIREEMQKDTVVKSK